jgi:hypothetical protein
MMEARVEILGAPALVQRVQGALHQALDDRRRPYRIEVAEIGRCGDILISINGTKGRLPLLFAGGELEPGPLRNVVQRTVERFGF